ncbi:MAG: FAD-dependent oxidoreductase [Oscillospiraceae bacterium]|nr:FAD-dependent oxidoreductase [Oscillospiraceae bacterium]
MEKLKLNIDGRELYGYKGQTILEVALENGIQIPAFCYDRRLGTYGACSICVVEVENSPKLLRSCATEIAGGMEISTDSPKVRESRKANLELLLSQHIGDCRPPCVLTCPAQTDCQGYVALIANGEIAEALKLIKEKIPLAASIGRVCPHPCEDACRRKLVEEPVSILNLKRFAADIDLDKPEPYLPETAPSTGKSVSIVGGGPGGLSCAYYLAKMGHSVTVYDAMPEMGGMLRYGIPEYRLPKEIVNKEVALIEKMGVVYKNNIRVGKDVTLRSLKESSDAVVIAMGAWKSMPLPCPGAELEGVLGGIDFLRKVYLKQPLSIGKNVAVVGGGNTAMDACRAAIRLGAEKVYIIYRRTRAEMPAEDVEIDEAEEEGVIFKYLVNPLEIIGENGKTTKMRLQKMKLGAPDASGRQRPEPIAGEEETLKVDMVIAALGQGIDPDGFDGIKLTRGNTIIADVQMFTTNEKGIFAIGDCINDGASIAISAVADAKKVAIAVNGYLSGIEIDYKEPYRVTQDDITEADFADYKKEPRSQARFLSPGDRKDNFLEVVETLDREAAIREAERCLGCGCHDYFECKLIALADRYDVQPKRFMESVRKLDCKDDHPLILRDPNKCIMCGLCVRVCEELIGPAALGLANRGFDTVVIPAFGDPLSDTSCISCGQCVSVCPTGALQERTAPRKPAPFETKKAETFCGMCALGCRTIVESVGNLLVKTTPAYDSRQTRLTDDGRGTDLSVSIAPDAAQTVGDVATSGIMCRRGRFGINYIQKEGRLITPMLKKNGRIVPADWDEAFEHAAARIADIMSRQGKIAVSIGHHYCAQDADAIINLSKLVGAEVFSFMNRANGLTLVLGYDKSPNLLEEVTVCDSILVFGSSILNNPVTLAKLRQAVKNGASVTVVSDTDGEFHLPCSVIKVKNSTLFIKQIVKALIEAGCLPENVDGFEELKASLSAVEPCEDAKILAQRYRTSSKAMALFSLSELSTTAAAEIANMAVVAGHIGIEGDGIFVLRQSSGSQILADHSVTSTADVALDAKGLIVFGEDPDIWPDEQEYEFIMVQDIFMTDTARRADVVFPMAVYPEISGTFISASQRECECRSAVEPPVIYRTTDIARKIAELLRVLTQATAACEDARFAIELENSHPASAPHNNVAPSFGDKAKLRVFAETVMFEKLTETSSLIKAVEADIST